MEISNGHHIQSHILFPFEPLIRTRIIINIIHFLDSKDLLELTSISKQLYLLRQDDSYWIAFFQLYNKYNSLEARTTLDDLKSIRFCLTRSSLAVVAYFCPPACKGKYRIFLTPEGKTVDEVGYDMQLKLKLSDWINCSNQSHKLCDECMDASSMNIFESEYSPMFDITKSNNLRQVSLCSPYLFCPLNPIVLSINREDYFEVKGITNDHIVTKHCDSVSYARIYYPSITQLSNIQSIIKLPFNPT